MPKYILSEAAQEDIRNIQGYTREIWGTAQTKTYLLELTATFTKLARRPKLGRRRDDLNLNLRSFLSGNHLVFYREAKENIEVVRVLHSSMDIPQHLEEE